MSRNFPPGFGGRDFQLKGWKVLTNAEKSERTAERAAAERSPPKPERITPQHGHYQGTELHRSPGIPAARFVAFELPSRRRGRLFYPDGRVEASPDPADSHPAPAPNPAR